MPNLRCFRIPFTGVFYVNGCVFCCFFGTQKFLSVANFIAVVDRLNNAFLYFTGIPMSMPAYNMGEWSGLYGKNIIYNGHYKTTFIVKNSYHILWGGFLP